MPDDQVASSSSRSHAAVAGGVGVVAGAGISTSLFSALGLAKIMLNPPDSSIAYPLVVFSLAALFLLTAALFTIRVTEEQRLIVTVGMACFMLMAIVGSGVIYWQQYSPSAFTEQFQPDQIAGEGMKSPKLGLSYLPDGAVEYKPLKTHALKLDKGGGITLKIDGIDDLIDYYKNNTRDDNGKLAIMGELCNGGVDRAALCREVSKLKSSPPLSTPTS